ncbi:hypothetical protein BJ742DRAFT_851955 [Cladochytrium replicatum]|nr:hypothetical protein BJ742DRAFT_851955 [Cladochytrium replicatum]
MRVTPMKAPHAGSPISHLAMCYTTPSLNEDPRFLAANSYDNGMDHSKFCGFFLSDSGCIQLYECTTEFQPPKFSYRQTDTKTVIWPIKSSFFYSHDDIVRRISSREDVYSGADGQAYPMDSSRFSKRTRDLAKQRRVVRPIYPCIRRERVNRENVGLEALQPHQDLVSRGAADQARARRDRWDQDPEVGSLRAVSCCNDSKDAGPCISQ